MPGEGGRPIEAVIVDCDGVLVDSEVLALEIELRLLAELGMPYDPVAFRTRFMGMPDAAFFPALDADSLARRGVPLPVDFRSSHAAAFDAACRDRLREVEGAGRAIARCHLPKAVASSSVASLLRKKLVQTGLWNAFAPHVYGGDLVVRGKPAPDLFFHAARALGVAPSRCLVIEDSVNGVRAGCAAGMVVWGFVGGGHLAGDDGAALTDAGATRILTTWSAFGDALDRDAPTPLKS